MKKFTSILLALAMLAAMTVIMIPTASAAWDGSSVSAGLIGSGSEFDPYLITSENDLAFVAKQVNDAVTTYAGEYLKLTVDLDLGNQPWAPIGQIKANYFSGHFDGDGHTISNLNVKTIDDANALYGGVFGRIFDGSVKNLTVDGAKVVSAKYGGAIAGVLNCTADGGSASATNCHAINVEVYGIQVGGVIGRSSQKKCSKDQLKITGCSATNITLGVLTTDHFASVDNGNHFVGGIVGGAGATTISGCSAKNITGDIYGTGFAPAGGIIGVLGADSQSADVTNCYAIGVTFTAREGCHPEKTSVGGLIGKAAHVDVSYGDPNTEYNLFNNFVSEVSITNNNSVNNGVLIGLVDDTVYFNDMYYVAEAGLASFGADTYFSEWPFMEIKAPSDLTAEKLNKGNSTKVWTDDLVAGHPVIDVDALLANTPNYVDYFVEHADETTAEETTAAPETQAPETQAPETQAPETQAPETQAPETAAPETQAPETKAPAQTEAPKAEGGCGGMVASGAVIIALMGAAVVFKNKKPSADPF